jgi:hypothetical protein
MKELVAPEQFAKQLSADRSDGSASKVRVKLVRREEAFPIDDYSCQFFSRR